jgi:hypothetical protein
VIQSDQLLKPSSHGGKRGILTIPFEQFNPEGAVMLSETKQV